MKVERIERSKHKQERVLVYLEGGNLLRITESELLRFGLYVGLDISPETVVQLQKSGARSETRVRAANMISARPLSKKELTRRLVQKGAEADDAGAAAAYLENIGALDDAAYAAMRTGLRSRPHPRRALPPRRPPRAVGRGAGNSPRRAGDARVRHRVENAGEAPERKGL